MLSAVGTFVAAFGLLVHIADASSASGSFTSNDVDIPRIGLGTWLSDKDKVSFLALRRYRCTASF